MRGKREKWPVFAVFEMPKNWANMCLHHMRFGKNVRIPVEGHRLAFRHNWA